MKQTRIDIFLAVILVAFIALVVIVADRRNQPAANAAEAGGAADTTVRFATLDVYVDPHKAPFAAYQLEIIPTPGSGRDVSYTGLTAGESHPAFSGESNIPYYDPKALAVNSSHLIIAALSTDAALPNEKTRVARVHVTYTGVTPPTFTFANSLVASPDAQKMDAATVTLDLVPTPAKN